MPFIERIADMDALRQKRTQTRPAVADGPTVRLSDADCATTAQMRLVAILWTDVDAREPSAVQMRLLRYAMRRTRDLDMAHDLVQDAYLETMAHWQEVTDAVGFMYRVLRLRVIDHWRVEYNGGRPDEAARKVVEPVGSVEDCAVIEERRANRKHWSPDDSSRATLTWILGQCQTSLERRIVRLALAEVDDEHVGYGRIAAYPDLDAIAKEMKSSESAVRQACKAIGIRLGLWVSERKAYRLRAQVGTRFSQWFLRALVSPSVWSTLGWYGLKSGRTMAAIDAREAMIDRMAERIMALHYGPRLLTDGRG